MKFRVSPLLIFLFAVSTPGLAEDAVILSQKVTPLQILSYTSAFQSKSRGRYDSHPDRILHKLTYKNVSDQAIVTLRLGITAFNALNEFMGKFGGWSTDSLDPGKENKGSWAQTPYAAFSFKNYGTGVVYVESVRFSDGTIWRADLDDVLEQLQKFEDTLEKEDLREKRR